MTTVASVRLDDSTARLVDQVANDRGMSRSDWLAAVVDRALVGEGRMSAETAAERRESRRTRPTRRRPPVRSA